MKKKIKFVGTFIMILFLAVSYYFDGAGSNIREIQEKENTDLMLESSSKVLREKENEKIIIYITGEIKNPGVYQVASDDRLINLVELAGGFTKKADKEKINLASPLIDGEKIEIPKKRAADEIKFIEQPGENGSSLPDDKINVNRANRKELEKITGIGPGKAKNIIDYRDNNGFFTSFDQLLNVSGIGEKTLEKIKGEISLR
ncbi:MULTISPECIES: helix-hairpin-helix domain-containing protein [unclassified Halanaerobium]|uniref:helix-hairpin-helix domain-containing protein n=1 Tax=unclassified Halanaerobium TaxID=2641197 RepID=UPI000DF3ABEC|nr:MULTISPECIES: helix-hairpin-helix domain-containing protein [unclassified Halanaerobium]RCW45409.1 competence protein ComEA [Halanaerobium sp. MA284_MarDTE_T2]RCW82587.1 competence protein ComEA [Halanaerobium sp. DL-01]